MTLAFGPTATSCFTFCQHNRCCPNSDLALITKTEGHANLSTDQRTSELQVRAECSSRKSKIGFVGLGQRYQPVVKEIAVILVARGSRERRVFDAAPALYCHPGRRKSARVLDKDRDIDRLAVGRKFP